MAKKQREEKKKNGVKEWMKKNTDTPSTSRLRLGYPEKVIETTLLEVKFEGRKLALQPKQKEGKRNFCFCHNISTISAKSKQILMKKWHLIEQQPLLSEIYRDPPLISYKRGRSLKDILVKAKL